MSNRIVWVGAWGCHASLNAKERVIELKKSVFREYAEAIIIAVLLAVFIRTYVLQAFKIPSGSMLPTLQIGDHLLVNKFIYGTKIPFKDGRVLAWKEIERQDIVVFRFPKDRTVDYIKRVVGVSGDIVQVKDKKVMVNGKYIEDSHAHFTAPLSRSAAVGPRDNFGPVKIPEGKIFVMGDNRDNSYDSRFWGYVDQKDVLGKALIIYWSWDIDESLFSIDRFTSVRWGRFGNLIN